MNSHDLQLQAGAFCLDFANTADWHASQQPLETLKSYPDLVAWAQKKGVLTEAEARRLLKAAEDCPAEAEAVLAEAIDLREAIYRLFSAIAARRPPEAGDLHLLNRALQTAYAHRQLAPLAGGFRWTWVGLAEALDPILWPAAHSAAELLTSAELERVKECADDRGCGYLFLDTSKNRSRQWCSMESCGNRAKVQRHRQRRQAAK